MPPELTDRSRRVLKWASDEARRLNHPFVDTPHLLLGMWQVVEGGGAGGILRDYGLTLQRLERSVRQRIIPASDVLHHGELPQTDLMQQCLALGRKEAERLKDPLIDTEHLLLGVLRLPHCAASQILTDQGVDLAHMRRMTLLFLHKDEDVQPLVDLHIVLPPSLSADLTELQMILNHVTLADTLTELMRVYRLHHPA